MLRILQARLQQYMIHELPDVQAGLRKGRGTRDRNANICRVIKKAKVFQKNIYFCFIDFAKAFGVVNKVEIDVFLKLSWFYSDPTDIGNLISGSSSFSKSSLNVWKSSVFIPIPKKGNAKECSNYCTIVLISHARKVMLKILQARLP